LLTFRTVDDSAGGVARVLDDYAAHCRAARVIAERYFDSNVVLSRLLNEVE
jgi:hypothetical protein